MQWPPAVNVLRIHIGAVLKKQCRNLGVAFQGGYMQGSPAMVVSDAHARTPF